MLKFSLAICLLCCTQLCCAQKREGNLSSWYDAQGIVSCITTIDSIIESPIISCGGDWGFDSSYTVPVFDERGNQLSSSRYDKDSNFLGRTDCQYDKAGNRIQTAYYDNLGHLLGSHTSKFDANGCPYEKTNYDSAGNIINVQNAGMMFLSSDYMLCFTRSGTTIKSVNYMFDCGSWETDTTKMQASNNNEREIAGDTVVSNNGGKKIYTITYKGASKYSNGGCVTLIEFDSRDNIMTRTDRWEESNVILSIKEEYKYDADGRKTEFMKFFRKGEAANDAYVPREDTLYDAAGRIKGYKEYYNDGRVKSSIVNTYNEHGFLIHRGEYDRNNSIKNEGFATYEGIDDHGNWLKSTSWTWGTNYLDNLPGVTYRLISYYE